MRLGLAACLRFLVNCFIFNESTYLIGMALIRVSRKCKSLFTPKNYQEKNTVVSNFAGKLKMNVDMNSYMGGSIFWCGFHHVSEILFLNQFLTSKSVFIDIGANQGEFSIFAASKVSEGKVISFEPVQKQYQRLTENSALNQFKTIETHYFGLSNANGELPIFTSPETQLHSGWHDGLSTLYASKDKQQFQQNVQLKVFDFEFENKLERIDLIKIDIEGAELFALKGMQQHLQKFKPAILIEMNDETFTSAGYSIREMDQFLRAFGYEPHLIHRGKLKAVSQNDVFLNWANYLYKVNEQKTSNSK
jgi:FkbM family methyltransferase